MKSATLVLVAAVTVLSACSEKPQTNVGGVKYDAVPWSGTGKQADTGTAFTAPDWKVGDKTAWQQQLKARTQQGQNEYNKLN